MNIQNLQQITITKRYESSGPLQRGTTIVLNVQATPK